VLSVWSEEQIVCIWSSWCHCIPKPHNLLPHLNLVWFYLSGSSLCRLSWKRGHYTDVVVVVVVTGVTQQWLCVLQSNTSGKWEATHMNSSEGENIMFLSSTILEGPVEVGLYMHCKPDSGWLSIQVVSVLNSGTVGPGLKSQPRWCQVTVLGKLFTPIVPPFTKQRNW